MRKIFMLLLAGALLIGTFAACGEKNNASSGLAGSGVSAQATATPDAEATPTPEPEESAEPTTAPTVAPASADLSEDVYSFQVEIDGTVYQFPMTYEEFVEKGWTLKDNATDTLRSNAYSSYTFEKEKSSYTASVEIVNFDNSELAINQCYVGGISLDDYNFPAGMTVRLPGGITLLESTNEDVVAAYGTPSRENKTDTGSLYLDYSKGTYEEVNLYFYAKEATDAPILLTKIEVENIVMPEDFQQGEVSEEVPEIVKQYQAPTAVSNDFKDWTVRFAEKIYKLPAPVSELLADGWVIDENETEKTVGGQSRGWIKMMKDNQKLKVLAMNYTPTATIIENCFVTGLYADEFDCKVDIEIANGIKLGMEEADLVKALGDANYEKDEDSSSYTYYKVMPTDSLVEYYQISVKRETELVNKIEVDFSPKYADYAGSQN